MLAKKLLICASVLLSAMAVQAQSIAEIIYGTTDSAAVADVDSVALMPRYASVCDSLLTEWPDSLAVDPSLPMPPTLFLPATFLGYDSAVDSAARSLSAPPADEPVWLSRNLGANHLARALHQHFTMLHPDGVPYNYFTLPTPPEQYVMVADPDKAIMVLRHLPAASAPAKDDISVAKVDYTRQNWINRLGINFQFSQGYVSPNWYQGGNSALNIIADFTYNTKLNDKFHSRLMFENFFQWRTALSSTQDDPYRKYSLTENRFQINSKFGYRAIYNWYYSFTGMFKTPVLNGYKVGTNNRTSSFLSPGELNVGLGMTYNHKAKNGRFDISLSISPLSYNLKTVLDDKVYATDRNGLVEGHHTKSSYGSTFEMNFTWKPDRNIQWKSRLFFFTNYDNYQADWQNTWDFTINRFLSARLKCDLRYDSARKPMGSWKRLQLNEYLSFGFAYAITH